MLSSPVLAGLLALIPWEPEAGTSEETLGVLPPLMCLQCGCPPWESTAHVVARCQELGMSLPGEMTLVPLEGVSAVQRLGIRAGSDEEAGGCKRPEWLLMKQNF